MTSTEMAIRAVVQVLAILAPGQVRVTSNDPFKFRPNNLLSRTLGDLGIRFQDQVDALKEGLMEVLPEISADIRNAPITPNVPVLQVFQFIQAALDAVGV